MSCVIGVRFSEIGKIYYFDPADFRMDKGDYVIVETSRGTEFGEVVQAPHEVSEGGIVKPLKKVLRVADERDMEKIRKNKERENEARRVCEEKVTRHKLDMKLIDVEHAFDGSKIIFYFTAEGRVDFRELVKDLASVFKTRIELRQIGVRDEAKKVGGLGPCGRPVCCASFLGDFQPVSIKMAKEQNLSLSPTKISGLCGRLMCCLSYEYEHYKETRKKLPRNGTAVRTPDGEGDVVETNSLTERVKVKRLLPDGTYDLTTYPLDQIKFEKRGGKKDTPPEVVAEEEVVLDEEIKSLLDE